MVMKIAKDFGTPIRVLGNYHVQCGTCDKVEGQFVTATNRLIVGTGTTADEFIARGWTFVAGEWKCPEC